MALAESLSITRSSAAQQATRYRMTRARGVRLRDELRVVFLCTSSLDAAMDHAEHRELVSRGVLYLGPWRKWQLDPGSYCPVNHVAHMIDRALFGAYPTDDGHADRVERGLDRDEYFDAVDELGYVAFERATGHARPLYEIRPCFMERYTMTEDYRAQVCAELGKWFRRCDDARLVGEVARIRGSSMELPVGSSVSVLASHIDLEARGKDVMMSNFAEAKLYRTYMREVRTIVADAFHWARQAAGEATDSATLAQHQFEGQAVRVVDRFGEPWFVARDVCAALGFGNHRQATSVLAADEKGVQVLDTLGGPQRTALISEPGLYRLIARSTKPAAKRFDRWVRHEVLPAVRKTGEYRNASASVSATETLASPQSNPTRQVSAAAMREIRRAFGELADAIRVGATRAELEIRAELVETLSGRPVKHLIGA